MKKKPHTIGEVSLSALEDAWQRKAVEYCIAAARGIVKMGGPIPPGTPIGRLGDQEWGWLIASILFSWIGVRARQAISENIDTDRMVRLLAIDPAPWDAGAVASILPELADCPNVDWSLPFGEWPQEPVIEFLCLALSLIRKATIARDMNDRGVTRKSSASVIARQANAAAGGPLMTPDELNDEIEL